MTSDHSAVRVERFIRAEPQVVYGYLTESARWARWQGETAEIEATPGGSFRMTMADGSVAEGQYLDLVPNRRVVVTWGWRGHPTLPPGSSTVEITLVSEGEGTLLILVHRGLPHEEHARHETGWLHYLPRLATVAEGGDPGSDRRPGADVPGTGGA